MQTPEFGDLVTVEQPGGPSYLNFQVNSHGGRLCINPLFGSPTIYLDALPDGFRVTNVVKERNRKRGSSST